MCGLRARTAQIQLPVSSSNFTDVKWYGSSNLYDKTAQVELRMNE